MGSSLESGCITKPDVTGGLAAAASVDRLRFVRSQKSPDARVLCPCAIRCRASVLVDGSGSTVGVGPGVAAERDPDTTSFVLLAAWCVKSYPGRTGFWSEPILSARFFCFFAFCLLTFRSSMSSLENQFSTSVTWMFCMATKALCCLATTSGLR